MINQEINLDAPASQIYDILTGSAVFSEVTGNSPTEIEAVEGGLFSCFGGMIIGRNIEMVKDKRIVQAWRAKPWEEGQYSLVRFDITDKGPQSLITLTHSAFPAGFKEHLDKGWHDNYWEPIKKYLEN